MACKFCGAPEQPESGFACCEQARTAWQQSLERSEQEPQAGADSEERIRKAS